MVDVVVLARAMDWVVPPDTSPGAGSPACVAHMVSLVESLPAQVAALYEKHLATLEPVDLDDPGHPLGSLFVGHVRDVYFSFPDTGAWADMGFKVTDP